MTSDASPNGKERLLPQTLQVRVTNNTQMIQSAFGPNDSACFA